MFFLIRIAFWMSIVIMLLPTGNTPADAPHVGAADALSAAGATVTDMRQFCARQPDACNVGSQAAQAFGNKAQASAKMVYDFFNEKLKDDPSAPARPAGARGAASQNTLTPEDRAPAWRGGRPSAG